MTDFDYHPKWDDLVHDEDLRQKYEEYQFDKCVAQAKEILDYFNYLVNNLNIPKDEAMNVLGITGVNLKNYEILIEIANKKERIKK